MTANALLKLVLHVISFSCKDLYEGGQKNFMFKDFSL